MSRSGTLTYQIGNELAQRGFGNSSIVGIGGDPVPGSSFIDIIELFEDDDETELIVMCGEIGGDAEEKAADYIAENVTKPVVAYIAGFTAPPGKTMGHAGAIVSGSKGTAAAKAEALEAKGVRVGRNPTQVAEIAVEILGARSSVASPRAFRRVYSGLPGSRRRCQAVRPPARSRRLVRLAHPVRQGAHLLAERAHLRRQPLLVGRLGRRRHRHEVAPHRVELDQHALHLVVEALQLAPPSAAAQRAASSSAAASSAFDGSPRTSREALLDPRGGVSASAS